MATNEEAGLSIAARRVAMIGELRPRQSFLRRALILGRRKPLGVFSLAIILTLIMTAILADVAAPADPYHMVPEDKLKGPSAKYLLGTDDMGRDILSRIIYGARISLYVGIIAVGIGTTSGTLWGVISGYFGGKVDLVIQRVMDSIMAFPMLILAMAIMAMLGPAITNVMIAIGIVMTPGASRVVRGTVMSIKENQYIEAAHSIGCSNVRIMWRHVLPNVFAPVIVIASVGLGSAIMTEASLSFLSLGTPPPTPSWGGMLSGAGRTYMRIAPWMAVFPGLALSLAVMGFNLLGDSLRDILDPRLRGSK